MARLFRPVYTKPVPPHAQEFTRDGRRWVRWTLRRKRKPAEGQERLAKFKASKARDGGDYREAELTDDGTRIRLQSKTWHGEYTDPNGLQTVPLSADKLVAEQMLGELIRKAGLASVGIRDPWPPSTARQSRMERRRNGPAGSRTRIGRTMPLCWRPWTVWLPSTRSAMAWLTGPSRRNPAFRGSGCRGR